MQVVGTEHEIPKAAGAKQTRAMVRTAVAGVGGYAGGELARLLLAHPRLGSTRPLFLGRVADEAVGRLFPEASGRRLERDLRGFDLGDAHRPLSRR